MFMDRLLFNRRGVALTNEERSLLEDAINEVRTVEARRTLVEAGREVSISTFLIEGLLSRFIDDRKGLRQLVAVHVPGDFVDLHAYPMRTLDLSISSLSAAPSGDLPCRRVG